MQVVLCESVHDMPNNNAPLTGTGSLDSHHNSVTGKSWKQATHNVYWICLGYPVAD